VSLASQFNADPPEQGKDRFGPLVFGALRAAAIAGDEGRMFTGIRCD